MTSIVNQILPIILLLVAGNLIKRFSFLASQTIEDLKRFVVNIALPAVLFLSFTTIELEFSYFQLSIVVFIICLILLAGGFVYNRILETRYSYSPYLCTGFEYGMLGVGLFASGYGIDQLGYIAIVDIGHEIFIWFVLLPLLLAKKSTDKNDKSLFTIFFTNPVVLAIIIGIAINLLGLNQVIRDTVVVGGIIKYFGFLADMTAPLILIIVGYGINLQLNSIRETLKIVLFRYALIIPSLFLINKLLLQDYLGLEKGFQIAFITLLILPSPFIIPMFMKNGEDTAQSEFVNNVLAVQTIVTVLLFSILLVVYPTLT